MNTESKAIFLSDTTIASQSNPKIKHALGLLRPQQRKKEGLMLVEGAIEIERALDSGLKPVRLFKRGNIEDGSPESSVIARCRKKGAEIVSCGERAFKKLAYREDTAGVIAILPQFRYELEKLKLSSAPLLLVSQGVEKPGNLGAILRSSDAAGVEAVIVCDRRTDIFNPNVIRASIGTLFSQPVIEAESDETLAWLKRKKVKIIAAAPRARTVYTSADLRGPSAIVIGEEHAGLCEQWLDAADEQVSIPMLGQADSLNVSAAAAVLLFEAVRQRGIQ